MGQMARGANDVGPQLADAAAFKQVNSADTNGMVCRSLCPQRWL